LGVWGGGNVLPPLLGPLLRALPVSRGPLIEGFEQIPLTHDSNDQRTRTGIGL
ncbi:MAG: hypothetical protein QOG57_3439, partial [Pseudonocardiales bacterium]|nr:hypothetical protein [Pseudonocardiales bacterium]